MRSLLARLAVLGAFAVSLTACGGGNGTSLPFAGSPNNAGGSNGTVQTGANNQTLLRFIQGSPDAGTGASHAVDVCVDNLPILVTSPSVSYAQASALYDIAGGITHTISVFPSITPSFGSVPGSECATAPGPYFGSSAIAVTTLAATAANTRITVVLGGTAASSRGLYVYTEPSFAVSPAGSEVISHNAAPVFSTGKSGVGFGTCTTTASPCAVPTALAGATNIAAPKASTATAAVSNGVVQSPLNAIPAGFYDGAGVPTGIPVPITSIAAPSSVAGQPYVVELYAIDAPAGGLNLVVFVEQTLGFGF